jgi:hypothetical protein
MFRIGLIIVEVIKRSFSLRTIIVFIFFFGQIIAVFDVNMSIVEAEKDTKVVDWDRLLIDEMDELNNYINKIDKDNANNNYTAIRMDSEKILSSSSLRNISAEIEYRGNSNIIQAFTNTVNNLINIKPNNYETIDPSVKNLSLLYQKMIQTLSVPNIDYQKLAFVALIPTIIFIVSIITIPKIRKHYNMKF